MGTWPDGTRPGGPLVLPQQDSLISVWFNWGADQALDKFPPPRAGAYRANANLSAAIYESARLTVTEHAVVRHRNDFHRRAHTNRESPSPVILSAAFTRPL